MAPLGIWINGWSGSGCGVCAGTMERTPQYLRDVLQVQDKTEEVLGDLERLGFAYKRVRNYRFESKSGGAVWCGCSEFEGDVTLEVGCTVGAVAHEMGHGFHECLCRDQKLKPLFKEDYAEAIRWFVESQLGWQEWPQAFLRRADADRDDKILVACQYRWPEFVQRLKWGEFFPDAR